MQRFRVVVTTAAEPVLAFVRRQLDALIGADPKARLVSDRTSPSPPDALVQIYDACNSQAWAICDATQNYRERDLDRCEGPNVEHVIVHKTVGATWAAAAVCIWWVNQDRLDSLGEMTTDEWDGAVDRVGPGVAPSPQLDDLAGRIASARVNTDWPLETLIIDTARRAAAPGRVVVVTQVIDGRRDIGRVSVLDEDVLTKIRDASQDQAAAPAAGRGWVLAENEIVVTRVWVWPADAAG